MICPCCGSAPTAAPDPTPVDVYFRVRHIEFLGGWLIQESRDGRYWFHPAEETKYGILDSETYTTYPTEDSAHARIASLGAGRTAPRAISGAKLERNVMRRFPS